MEFVFDHWRLLTVLAATVVLAIFYRFVLWLCGVIIVPDDSVGVVTKKFVLFGSNRSLPDGRIVALQGEAGFQASSLSPGLHIGLWPWQYAVHLAGFLTVPPGKIGVVIAFVGKEGTDVTGESFRHGNLVVKGEKGVWVSPLDPGRYPLNPYTHKVSNVPTTNVVSNWATGNTEAHKLDADLSTITVRSADGFKFNLDVSQIIHIPRSDAPKVIARFGDMSALVTQVLEPAIGNYFRNAAQGSDIIDFLKNRSARQTEAREAISALAATQAKVVDAERQVAIAEFSARATVKSAEGEGQAKKINAEADANVLRTVGDAQAAKTKAVGAAEAEVIRLKIDSMEAGNYAVVQVADALAKSGAKLVPDIVAGGGAGQGGNLVDVLLAGLIRDGVDRKSA